MFTTIMYHYVRDLQRSRYPAIKGLSVEEFKGQLAYIQRHYQVLTLDDCIAALEGREQFPANGLLLTFDDGFLDHFTVVFPILLNAGLTGVFFPPGQAIIEGKVLDVHKIHFVLASVADVDALIEKTFRYLDRERSVASEEIPANDLLWSQLAEATRLDSREIIFIKRLLQFGLPATTRANITNQLFQHYVTADESAFAAELYLSPDQMRAMHQCGMHFGSHGWSHQWLNTLSPEQQANDLDRAIEFLKNAGVWTPDWSMSYPYGGHNETTIELLQQRGCKMAFTVEVELSDPAKAGAYRLARLDTKDLPTKAESRPIDRWA